MLDFEDFEAVFGSSEKLSYDAVTVEKIRENRVKLGGELFLEKLLKALGVKETSRHFPPKTHANLRELHNQITASASPDHHKHSVIFYLLKDLSQKTPYRPQDFAKAVFLPKKYETFIDGIWLLDRRMFEKSLDYLTEPSLTPTFPEDILYTFCRYTRYSDFHLPIAYYNSVSPPLSSEKVRNAYFSVLCRTNVTEAFYFSKSQGDSIHLDLFQQLIKHVLNQDQGEKKASQCLELVSLPLNETEETWFHQYLKEEAGRDLDFAADTVIMRESLLGKPNSHSSKTLEASTKKIAGVDWSVIAKTAQGASG